MSPDRMPSPAKRFRLTRNFALLSAVVLLATALGLSLFYRSWAVEQMEAEAEQSNVSVARLLANSLLNWDPDILARLGAYSPGDLPGKSEVADLAAHISALVRHAPIIKVKIYDLDGHTLFSTDHQEIGANEDDDDGVISAAKGIVASELVHANTIDAFEGQISDRDIISSYVPIRAHAGQAAPVSGGASGGQGASGQGKAANIIGVFEVYTDVTSFVAAINRFTVWLIAITVGGALVINLVLVLIVGRGDRLLQRQHERSLELARTAAQADERNKAKTEFLANMSHELRTPLNAIIGFSDLMLKQTFGPLGDVRYGGYVSDIHAAGGQLLGTVENILDLTKIELGRMELRSSDVRPADVVDEVFRSVAPLAAAHAVDIRSELPEDLPVLVTDPGKLRKCLVSLMSNAVKFSPSGGTVILSCCRLGGGWCQFAVIDRGIGMSPEEIPIALSPFRQVDGSLARKFDGAGLGLPLAKALSTLLGGRLEIESAAGSGTIVTIMLPVHPVSETLPARAAATV
ncbi:MAG TPA: HAMP domain-containing sensor histidine kinase [Terriglobales bacterium]|nr:HAMP domain-containing sensor histidine kinase [Terriglobales bacterium]